MVLSTEAYFPDMILYNDVVINITTTTVQWTQRSPHHQLQLPPCYSVEVGIRDWQPQSLWEPRETGWEISWTHGLTD